MHQLNPGDPDTVPIKKMRLQKLTNQIKRLNPDIASTEAQMHMKRHQGLQQNSHMRC